MGDKQQRQATEKWQTSSEARVHTGTKKKYYYAVHQIFKNVKFNCNTYIKSTEKQIYILLENTFELVASKDEHAHSLQPILQFYFLV